MTALRCTLDVVGVGERPAEPLDEFLGSVVFAEVHEVHTLVEEDWCRKARLGGGGCDDDSWHKLVLSGDAVFENGKPHHRA
jgi:hypothetical protein